MAKDDISIPSWQKTSSSNAPNDDTNDDAAPSKARSTEADDMPSFEFKEVDEMPPIPTREEAAKFLEHPGAKGAAAEDKIRFLELKGVQRADIEALLPESKEYYDAEAKRQAKYQEPEEESYSEPLRDVPPVVTYPEFLVKSRKPPPLITTDLILKAMYGTAGAVAGMYALSKYILAPMHEELTSARHDFFTHTTAKANVLNTKLGSMSKLPTTSKPVAAKAPEDTASVNSDDSDPAELFHRDVGVQTDPSLSRQQSSWSLDASSNAPQEDPSAKNESKVLELARGLVQGGYSRDSTAAKDKELTDQLHSFATYLDELLYSQPLYKSGIPGWPPSAATATTTPQDEMDRFKKEIREMKGTLLSARNFPRGGT